MSAAQHKLRVMVGFCSSKEIGQFLTLELQKRLLKGMQVFASKLKEIDLKPFRWKYWFLVHFLQLTKHV